MCVCVSSSVVVVSVCALGDCRRLSVIRVRWTTVHSLPFSSSLPSLLLLFCLLKRSGNSEGYRAPILIFFPFFFGCLVRMGEVNIKFLEEVLFLAPVSLRHPAGKWRDENCTLGYPEIRGERMYLLFWPKRGSSWTDRALAVQRECVCVCVFLSVCLYEWSLWDSIVAIFFSVRGMLAVACSFCLWPSFSPLEAIFKEKLPDSAGFWSERGCPFKHIC